MTRFLDLWWRVTFCFILGNGIFAVLVMLLWYVVGIDYWTGWADAFAHSWLIVLIGCTAVALAIYDGQFIGDVKRSHWSNKTQE